MVFKTKAEMAAEAEIPAVEQPAVEAKVTTAEKRTRLAKSRKQTEIELLDLRCKHQNALGALATAKDYQADSKIVDDLAGRIARCESRLASFDTVSQAISDEVKAEKEQARLAAIDALKADVRRGLDRRLQKDSIELDQAFDAVIEVLERWSSNGEWTSEKAKIAAEEIGKGSEYAFGDFMVLAYPRTRGNSANVVAAATCRIKQIIELIGGTLLPDIVEVNPYAAKIPSTFRRATELDIATLSSFFDEAKA